MDEQYLLILTHMRSRSSLLSHILGSNPEISGYGEMKVSYCDIGDLQILKEKVRQSVDDPTLNRIIMDKIVDSDIPISPQVLNHPNVKTIFLLRRPEPTFASIMHLARTRFPIMKRTMFSFQYYLERTTQMCEYAGQLTRKGLFIESDQLINSTELVFRQLQEYLELKEPLQKEYKVFKFTGVRGYSDPSDNLKTGKVLEITGKQPAVELSADLQLLMRQAYDQCYTKMRNACIFF